MKGLFVSGLLRADRAPALAATGCQPWRRAKTLRAPSETPCHKEITLTSLANLSEQQLRAAAGDLANRASELYLGCRQREHACMLHSTHNVLRQ